MKKCFIEIKEDLQEQQRVADMRKEKGKSKEEPEKTQPETTADNLEATF